MTLQEIKNAVESGARVHWASELYRVVKSTSGQYLILCESNNSAIGLTWRDGVTLNGREDQFFIGPERAA